MSESNDLLDAINSLDSGDVMLPDIDRALSDMDMVNPLDAVPDTDDSEADNKNVMSAALAAFKAQAKNETKTFQDNTETEYWFCVCFQNREQKEEFLKKAGWFNHGDKYLDGQFVAKKMGIEIPEVTRKFNTGEVEKSMVAIGTFKNPSQKK